MKRFLCCFICIVLMFSFAGCNSSDNTSMRSGSYYAEGDYEEGLTPYVSLSLDDNTFGMGAGSLVSFQAVGSFKINGNKLIASTQITSFVFEIKDSKTLVLIDNGDNKYFQLAENTEFVFCGDKQ